MASSAGNESSNESVLQTSANKLSREQLNEAYGRMEMNFEANKGQTDTSVGFLTRGAGYALFLKPNEAVFALSRNDVSDKEADEMPNGIDPNRVRPDAADQKSAAGPAKARSVLRIKLGGANAKAEAAGADELEGKANYFIGNDPSKWRTDVPTYGRVRYSEIYRGVDVEYYGNQRQLEYDFSVAPGADYRQISLKFAGADSVKVEGETGDLLIGVNGQTVRQHKPVVYQELAGERQEIESRFVVKRGGRVGFEVGEYDATRPLVIDPVLVYSTYLGGVSDDAGYGIAVDNAGNAYVTGYTTSANFPTANPIQGTRSGGFDDVFVTKINAAGSAIVYSTYLGGNGNEEGYSIAADSSGNAYVTGSTYSTNFPIASPIQGTHGAGDNPDAFVAKINAAGSALIYSTYLGGNDGDIGYGIAVDAAGSAYVIGTTQSSNFPTVNPLQSANSNADAFVTKINAAGSALTYSTYLGGTSNDVGSGIAVDSQGNAYVTGSTSSTNFPMVNPIQGTTIGGAYDAFVAKINTAGSALVYSTYLGGNPNGQANYDDFGRGIAVDSAGNAYVVGQTSSPDFLTYNAIQAANAGISDAFVTKINPAGSALVYSTFLGGNGQDAAYGVAVDAVGNAFVTGVTNSNNFPTNTAIQGANRGLADVFVTKINAAGSTLAYSTYLGGGGDDIAYGIAADPSGNAYITGRTASGNFPIANPIRTYAGSDEAFVSKIADIPGTTPTPSPTVTPSPTPMPTPTPVPTPVPASRGDLVISQVYGGGGAAGATYRNSYVEIFNRSASPVITHTYAIALGLGTSPIDRSFSRSDSRGVIIQSGQHLLVKMGSGGNNGSDLPQADLDVQSTFPSPFFGLSGKLALTGETANNSVFADCPLAAQGLLDFVGFGATNCFEGSGPISGLNVTTAALRKNNGCVDMDDNASDFTIGAPNPRNSSSPFNPCSPPPTPTPTPTVTPTPSPSPTPSLVTVDGRVLTSDLRGLRNGTVSITDSHGVVRIATTSSFGFFSFDNVLTGDTYTIRISSRLYRYSPQTVQVNGNVTLPDFVGLE